MSFQYAPLSGDTPQARSWINHRATVRYQCAPATPGRVELTDEEFQHGWVQNLSLGGIGLVLPRPVDPGLYVVIQLKCPQSKKVYKLPAQVAHSTLRAGGDWLVGCEFVNKISPDDLDELLG